MKRHSSTKSFRAGLDEHDGNLPIPLSSSGWCHVRVLVMFSLLYIDGACINCVYTTVYILEGKRKYEDRLQSLLVDGMKEAEEEEELCYAGQSCLGEKKRRLGVEQVKALEKNFEVDNKLYPEMKVRLAQELGLQPRQVAIWFQNRRARWKTKKLEHDYGALKARHDALRIDCEAFRCDKEALLAEISELKSKLESQASAVKLESKAAEEEMPTAASLAHKDGASDSDSSAVFNEEASASVYSGVLVLNDCRAVSFRWHSSLLFEVGAQNEVGYMEEGFLSGEEPCSSLFSEEEAPSLSWYCSGGWD